MLYTQYGVPVWTTPRPLIAHPLRQDRADTVAQPGNSVNFREGKALPHIPIGIAPVAEIGVLIGNVQTPVLIEPGIGLGKIHRVRKGVGRLEVEAPVRIPADGKDHGVVRSTIGIRHVGHRPKARIGTIDRDATIFVLTAHSAQRF